MTETAPRRRGRPARHTTAEITAVACALADRDGLDAVTTRRVASELGIGAASLYTYVATRDDLLDLMQDAVADEHQLSPLTGDGIADVAAVALHTREILLRHPWAASIAEARPAIGRRSLDLLDHVLAALADHPADDASKLEAYGAVNAVIAAYVRSETADHHTPRRTVAALAQVTAERHPHLAALRVESQQSGPERLQRLVIGMLHGILNCST